MIMSITRRVLAAALVVLAIKFVPTAAAQAPADSTVTPTITLQINRSVSVADSARGAATNQRRVWDVQGAGEKRRTVRGAVIGGVTGTLLGAAAGAYIAAGFCDAADCSDDGREGALVGGAIGLGAGAAIGALIGYVW
jgi:hypothetical protein